mmetsp:Transcript_57580/g.187021  ORF Transcript_57580/g.187021 Transcript_57580/m.187021 type:complete len:1378 (+) Transcript_57580:43-4176(+)
MCRCRRFVGRRSHSVELMVVRMPLKMHLPLALSSCIASMYQLNKWLIKPATCRQQCSYVELVSTNAVEQRPEWFVSHWWGEPVAHFVFCLQEFSQQRQHRDVFWVCAYCNNQHALGGDITIDPSRSSFGRAFAKTRGAVVVLDKDATPFQRTWCAFEMAVAIRSSRIPRPTLDIATFVEDPEADSDEDCSPKLSRTSAPSVVRRGFTIGSLGKPASNTASKKRLPVHGLGPSKSARELESYLTLKARGSVRIISDGHLPEDQSLDQIDALFGRTPSKKKALREQGFPLEMAANGLSIAIEHSQASEEPDKRHILNFIAGQSELESEYPRAHPAFDSVNTALRARFAQAILRKTVESGQVELWTQALEAISRDSKSSVLDFDFDGCAAFCSGHLAEFAVSLPDQLEGLSLHCDRCTQLSDPGLEGLGLGLQRLGARMALRSLFLDFRGCSGLGPEGLRHLGVGLRQLGRLADLSMSFEDLRCGIHGLDALSKGFFGLSNLLHLKLSWQSCHSQERPEGNLDMIGFAEGLGHLRNLRTLDFDYSFCKWSRVYGLGDGLKRLTKLEMFALNLNQCNSATDRDLCELAGGLGELAQLSMLVLSLEDTAGLGGNGGLKCLGENIGRLKRLAKLELNLSGCTGFTDLDAQGLGLGLGSAVGMTEMRLAFQSTAFGDCGLQGLGDSIGRLRQLTKLHLDIANCSLVSDVGVAAFSAGLGKLRRLGALHLGLFRCGLGGAGLRELGTAIGQVTSLRELHGEFQGLFHIDDTGLSSFGAGIGRLKNLKDLDLNFYRCSIGDTGLNGLGKGLASLRQLENLNLDFRHCSQITNEALLKDFGRGLGRQTRLLRLRLDFGGCISITDTGLKGLGRGLEKLQSLQAVRLDFGDCLLVSDEGVLKVAQGLESRVRSVAIPLADATTTSRGGWTCRQSAASLADVEPEVELELCFLFTRARPNNQWIACSQHVLSIIEEDTPMTGLMSRISSRLSLPSLAEGRPWRCEGMQLLSTPSLPSSGPKLRKAASVLHDSAVPESMGADAFLSCPDVDQDRMKRRAHVPDPYFEASLLSRGLFVGERHVARAGSGYCEGYPCGPLVLPTSVPNLYEITGDGRRFDLSCTERNRCYAQRPDDSQERLPRLEDSQSIVKAQLDIPLNPIMFLRFSCQLVLRVTERWGMKFAGVALVTHPDGRQHIVYLPGVLTFDPAGITGDPHSSERVGPACDRIQIGKTVAQLCLLQHGGTLEDLDRLSTKFEELIYCFSGRLILCSWMRHQVEKACLDKSPATPYPAFLQALVDSGELCLDYRSRTVTKEYLESFAAGVPTPPEAYLNKVHAKDRCCFGRSNFGGLNTTHRLDEFAPMVQGPVSPCCESAAAGLARCLQRVWPPCR